MLRKVLFIAGMILAASGHPAAAQSSQADEPAQAEARELEGIYVPRFRHVEINPPKLDLNAIRQVRFLTENTFPPFSYTNANGSLTGLNVAIADAICSDLRIRCEFIIKPWAELQKALEKGEGDAILSGVRMTEAGFDAMDFTRPFFRSAGRFAVRVENPMKVAGQKVLAGRRVGVHQGSAHEAFLKHHFKRSKIVPFEKHADAREALRTGAVDALFGDGVRLMFWVHSDTSKSCCRITDGAYRDKVYLDVPLAIAVKRGNHVLREILDHGLDRLQTSGQFTRIYRTFFPESVW